MFSKLVFLAYLVVSIDVCGGLAFNDSHYTNNKKHSTNDSSSYTMETEDSTPEYNNTYYCQYNTDKLNHWPSLIVRLFYALKERRSTITKQNL